MAPHGNERKKRRDTHFRVQALKLNSQHRILLATLTGERNGLLQLMDLRIELLLRLSEITLEGKEKRKSAFFDVTAEKGIHKVAARPSHTPEL